jgi:hypothetical protein
MNCSVAGVAAGRVGLLRSAFHFNAIATALLNGSQEASKLLPLLSPGT